LIFGFSSVLGEEVGIEGLLWYLGGCWVEEWEKRGGGDENGGMGGRRGWRGWRDEGGIEEGDELDETKTLLFFFLSTTLGCHELPFFFFEASIKILPTVAILTP